MPAVIVLVILHHYSRSQHTKTWFDVALVVVYTVSEALALAPLLHKLRDVGVDNYMYVQHLPFQEVIPLLSDKRRYIIGQLRSCP